MARANALHGRKSRPNECSISTRLGSPRGSPLAGPGSMAARTSRQTQRRAARTGQAGLIAAVGTRPLIRLPRQFERLHSSTFSVGATRSHAPPFLLIEVKLHRTGAYPLDLTAVILHIHSFHARKLPRDGVVIDHLQEELDI
jgi:hypothetical protein